MTILHRYIFGSVFITSSLAVGLIAAVLVAGNALKDMIDLLVKGQLSFGVFFELLYMLVPVVLSYALPFGILTGVLLVLGRLSTQNEIMAMRSAGVGLYRIASPIFFLAVMGVGACLVVNLFYAPNAKSHYKKVLRDTVRVNPVSYVVEKTFIREFPGRVIYVEDKDGDKMINFWLWELDDESRVTSFIRAESAHLEYDEKDDFLLVVLKNCLGEKRIQGDPEDFSKARVRIVHADSLSHKLPLDKIMGGGNSFRKKMSWMNFNELMGELRRWKDSPPEGMTPSEIARGKMQVQIVLHEKLALGFSVLSLAFLGVPLGIKVQRKETSANLAIAIGLSMLFYFSMNMIGLLDKYPAYRPDLLLWLPNFMYQALGFWLWSRIPRSG
ncbi:MAG: LptF/LptG family permease [Opitutaceae bacterium]|nr:LptF/LptG family permease [Opitutaceae bacterium]